MRRAWRQSRAGPAPDRARALLDRRTSLPHRAALRRRCGRSAPRLRKTSTGASTTPSARWSGVSGDVHFQQVLRFLETRLADGLATFGLYEKILKGARERDQPTPRPHRAEALRARQARRGRLPRRPQPHLRASVRPPLGREHASPGAPFKTYRRYAIAAGVALLIGAVVAGGWITYLQMQLNERQQLEARGVAITAAEGREGTRIAFPVDASQALLEEAAPLLKAVGPVTELDLSGTKVTDLAPLANLTDLQALDLGRTILCQRSASRRSARALYRWLGAPGDDASRSRRGSAGRRRSRRSPTSPTCKCSTSPAPRSPTPRRSPTSPTCNALDLAGTQVADAAPLANLTNLQSLDLSGTQVADAAPLANLTNLQCARPRRHPGRRRRAARQAHQPARARPLRHPGRRRRAARQPHQPAIARPRRHPGRRRRAARQAHQPAMARPLRHPGRRRRAARQPHQPAIARPLRHPGRRRRAARQPHQPAMARPLRHPGLAGAGGRAEAGARGAGQSLGHRSPARDGEGQRRIAGADAAGHRLARRQVAAGGGAVPGVRAPRAARCGRSSRRT